jgi:IS4 transposase
MWRQVRLTLALTYVLPEDSNLSIVQRLLQRMQQLGFRPSVVYMDKAFFEIAIVRYLTTSDIPALIACPIRGKRLGTRPLCQGRKAYVTDYRFHDGTLTRAAVVPTRPVHQFTRRRHLKWRVYLLIHLDWSAHKASQRYRRRFAIESSYRQFGSLRARTTSRNPALRFFLLALALFLRNIWLLLRWLTTRAIDPGLPRWRPKAFRLSRFIAFLRRALEAAYPTTNSIAIYSS